jgi:hypothetical protein
MKCFAITKNGRRCRFNAIDGEDRCRIHVEMRIRDGPHRTQRNELRYVHQHNVQELLESNDPQVEEKLQELERNYIEHREALRIRQLQEIDLLGFNPDQEANQRLIDQRRMRMQRRIRARDLFLLEHFEQQVEELDPPRLELAQLAHDPQNIHTSRIVEQTKRNIETIFKCSSVPEDYQWNLETVSKTPGKILTNCKLSREASCQMLTMYVSGEPIYDLEPGIYGKILDHLWQYIRASEHREDLCKILKHELEDNVGMCAQGNLSRLCNVLNGYLEEMEQKESTTEYLGRVIPKLVEMFSQNKQLLLQEIQKEFKKVALPEEQWQDWIDSAMND